MWQTGCSPRLWEADSPLVSVMPRILRVVTRTMPGIGRGGIAYLFFLLSVKMISLDLSLLSFRLIYKALYLLSYHHDWTWLVHEEITVSGSYLNIISTQVTMPTCRTLLGFTSFLFASAPYWHVATASTSCLSSELKQNYNTTFMCHK